MNSFTIYLQSITKEEQIHNVMSFVSEDDSGKYGVMANHCRMLTNIKIGMSKITYTNFTTEYLALASGIIYFTNNKLYINTKNYTRSDDYYKLVEILNTQLKSEDQAIKNINETIERVDEMVLKRLWELEQAGKI